MTLVKKKSIIDHSFSFKNRLYRFIWFIIYYIFFRPSPVFLFKFRVFLLKLFGAKIDNTSRVYPSCIIWSPRNLTLQKDVTIGRNVNIYNQGHITINNRVIVSQNTHLCASTHDYNIPIHPLILKPIIIKQDVWVCADAFIGPGVIINEGCVIGARCVILKSTEAWSVYTGNPSVMIKKRVNFNE